MLEKLIDKLIVNGIITSDEQDIVMYGLQNIELNLIGLLITIIIGIIFGKFHDAVMLWIMMFPLRKNAGGFHAKTKKRCIFISAAMIGFVFVLFNVIELSSNMLLLIGIICGVLIFWMSPVHTINKLLDDKEIYVYKRRTRVILVTETFFLILSYLFNWMILERIVVMTFFIIAIALSTGHIQVYLLHRSE